MFLPVLSIISPLENGPTIRGCKKDLTKDFEVILDCDTNNCNTEIVPKDRLRCHQCTIDDLDCAFYQSTDKKYLRPCENYLLNDLCYSIFLDSNEFYRGCISDQDNPAKMCVDESKKCVTCSESNCNAAALTTQPSLYCVQCSEMDESCIWGFPIGAAKICKKSVPFYTLEGCFVSQFTNGSVRRGCYEDELDFCTTNDCRRCFTQECNRESVIEQSCYQCSSLELHEEDCTSNPHSFSRKCQVDPTFEDQGCYSYRDCKGVKAKDIPSIQLSCFHR